MNGIDWSKAPEAFPIWIEVTDKAFGGKGGWHRELSDRYISEDGTYWTKPDEGYYSVHHRPVWNGGGLPPVGTVVEVNFHGDTEYLPHSLKGWIDGDKVTCVAHYALQGGDNVSPIFFNKRLFTFSALREDCYEPIRTAEQIAADKRLHLIRNACTAINGKVENYNVNVDCSIAIRATIEAMIDAGYHQ